MQQRKLDRDGNEQLNCMHRFTNLNREMQYLNFQDERANSDRSIDLAIHAWRSRFQSSTDYESRNGTDIENKTEHKQNWAENEMNRKMKCRNINCGNINCRNVNCRNVNWEEEETRILETWKEVAENEKIEKRRVERIFKTGK